MLITSTLLAYYSAEHVLIQHAISASLRCLSHNHNTSLSASAVQNEFENGVTFVAGDTPQLWAAQAPHHPLPKDGGGQDPHV